MPRYITTDGSFYIPNDIVEDFERDNPDAKVEYEDNGDVYHVPISDRDSFLKEKPNATFSKPKENPVVEGVPAVPMAENVSVAPTPSVKPQEKTALPNQPIKPITEFGEGVKEGGKQLVAGAEFAAGETLRPIVGTSEDDKAALERIESLEKEGKDVAKNVQSTATISPAMATYLKVFGPKGSSDFVRTMEKTAEANIAAQKALNEADGNVEQAKSILEEKANKQTIADTLRKDAERKMAEARPTKGWGWVGSMIPQMVGTGVGLGMTAVTKNPMWAQAIGLVNMAGLTASAAGSAMAEARQAGASNAEVWTAGLLNGGIENISERFALGKYTKRLVDAAKKSGSQAVKKAVAEVGSPARKELAKLLDKANKQLDGKLLSGKNVEDYIVQVWDETLSEGAAEALQTVAPMLYQNPDDYPNLWGIVKDVANNTLEGMKGGMFMGFALGGLSKSAEHRMNRARRKAQGFVDVAEVINPNGTRTVVEVVKDDNGEDAYVEDGKYVPLKSQEIGRREQFKFDDFERGQFQNEQDESYEIGKTLETTQEMKDANTMLQKTEAEVRRLLGDNAGDANVDEMLGNNPLEFARQKYEEDEEVGQAILDYLNAKATEDGIIDNAKGQIKTEVEQAEAMIDSRKSLSDGMIHPAVMKTNDRQVYVINGYVERFDDGNVDTQKSGDSIIVMDATTGKKEFVSPKDLLSIDVAIDPEVEKKAVRTTIGERIATDVENKLNGVLAFNPNDTYEVLNPQGERTTVQVVSDNGDGTINVIMGDAAEPIKVTKNAVQTMADNLNSQRADEMLQGRNEMLQSEKLQKEAEQMAVPTATETPAEVAPAPKVVPTTKDGKPDFNAMDAEMFVEEYTSRYGEESTEKIARKNIAVEREKIAKLDKKIDDVTDPNQIDALYEQRQASEAVVNRYNEILERLGLSEDANETEAEQKSRLRNEANNRIASLFPDGMPNVESFILADIATGNRLRWSDKKTNGVVTSRGLGAELGLSDTERIRRLPLIGKDAMTPEEYAESLRERLDAVGIRYDESSLRDAVLDVYSSVDSRKGAWDALENISKKMQEPQADMDWEDMQKQLAYNKAQENVDNTPELPSLDTIEEETPISEGEYAEMEAKAQAEEQADYDAMMEENPPVEEQDTNIEPKSQEVDEKILQEEQKVNVNPTDGQKEAGNYKKGHVVVDGFNITIEQPKGSVRSGVDADGKEWSITMNNTYGYIRGTEGVDGDHIDVFLSDNLDNWGGEVFVVDQINTDGSFDEHKVMYGFNSIEEAQQAYLSNYSEGWQGLGAITGISKDEFKKWIASSHRKTKPFAEYKSVKTTEGQAVNTTDSASLAETTLSTGLDTKEEARRKPLRERAKMWEEKVGVKVNLIESEADIPTEAVKRAIAEGQRLTGWVADGQVYLYMPYITNRTELDKTYLHEVVAHVGMENLLTKEGYKSFCERVFNEVMSDAQREYYLGYPGVKNEAMAADEFIAHLAEDTDMNASVWQKIVRIFRDALRKMGVDIHLTNADIEAMLRDSYKKLVEENRVDNGAITPAESENGILFRAVTDPKQLKKLEEGETMKVYRAMQVIDGKLYPPMSAKVNGKLREPIELGVWEEAEENPSLADDKGYFKLDKGNKKSLKARYNPYIHTSTTPLNDQFSEAQDRPNLVTVEVEIPVSELTSGYKAEKAKDAVGKLEWKAGVVQGKLSGTRTVILSRWDKPIRIVPDSEVADVIVDMFDGRDITMPSNVVTPSLRTELEKRGIPFVETDNQGDIRFRSVYHGSGAEFDKFDHSFIGTGEGNQAFGWGTYVTEDENKARAYAQIHPLFYNKRLELSKLRREQSKLSENIPFLKGKALKKATQELEKIKKALTSLSNEANRYLYSVEIPDNNGNNYLEHGKVLSKVQQNKIKEKLYNRLIEIDDYTRAEKELKRELDQLFDSNEFDGKDVYGTVSSYLGSDKDASAFLNELGYVGISYPANDGKANGARNYVIFNEADLDITDNIRFRSVENAPTFYSNAENAVRFIKQEKATPEQWLKMIEKNGGLKAGEDKWLGLSDWLKASDKKTLTKDEVLDFIKENEIQIEEVQYGDGIFSRNSKINLESELQAALENGHTIESALSRWDNEFGDNKLALYERGFFTVDKKGKIHTDEPVLNHINRTRLNYTTYGLDNKREIALTVPTVESWDENDVIHFGDAGNGRAVAWVRFGETTDAEGNRVLVIDEVQSKRHQEGREKGYVDNKPTLDEVRAAKANANVAFDKVLNFEAEMKDKYDAPDGFWTGKSSEEDYTTYTNLLYEWETLSAEYNSLQELRSSIPSAPFEKNWAELAMKRMLRYAAENGFDKVAWTTGEQQNERYDLSKSIDRIVAEDNTIEEASDGTPMAKDITLTTVGGMDIRLSVDANGVVRGREYDGKKLSDVVGKPLADKLMQKGYMDISGNGLRIGGEGMKAFYDQMLPSFMNKYGKKWGVKVGEVTMPDLEENNTMHSIYVTDAMRESVMQGQPMFRTAKTNYESQFAELQSEYDALDKNDAEALNEWRDKKADVVRSYISRLSNKFGLKCELYVFNGGREEEMRKAYDTMVEKYKAEGIEKVPSYESFKKKVSNPKVVATHRKSINFVTFNTSADDAELNIEQFAETLFHENAHRIAEKMYSKQEFEQIWENAKKSKNSIAKSVEELYSDKSDAQKGNEFIAKAIGELVSNHNRLFTNYLMGKDNISAEDLVKKLKYSLPLGKLALTETLNEFKNEYQERVLQGSGSSILGGGRDGGDIEVSKRDGGRNRKRDWQGDQKGQRAERRLDVVGAATDLAESLGVKLNVIEDVNEITDSNTRRQRDKRGAKAWYDVDTDQVYFVAPNATSIEDAHISVLHEVVAHKGLRDVVGRENFNKFLDKVFYYAEKEIRSRIVRLASQNGWNFRVATEEYLASLAEEGFDSRENRTFLQKVRDFFMDMLREAKIAIGFNISDNDMRYMLWRTYQMQKSQGAMAVAEDVLMQQKMGVGNFRTQPTGKSMTEEEQIIADAKANGTYLKAPNGKDTNLTPKQWAQVRTKAFKKWFGDWEKAARIEKLRKSKDAEITGNEIEASEDLKQYRKNALEYGKTLRGEYVNKDTGEAIVINKDSITEVLHHDGSNIAHIQSVAAIPQMVESGIYITSEPISETASKKMRNAKMAHYYVCGLKIDNIPYTVKFVVAEFESGEKYYDHSLTEIEKGDLLNRAELSSTVADSKSPISDIKDKRLVSILQTNSSKVVDANGEPKVVEHSTWNDDFYTFDIEHLGESSGDEGVYGAGFYFGNIGNTEIYGDRAIQAYLNMRNPIVLPNAPIRGFFDYLVKNFDNDGLRDIVVNQGNKTATMGDVVDAIKDVNKAHARDEYAALIEQMSQYWSPADEMVIEQQIFRKIGFAIYGSLEPFIEYNVGRKEFSEALRNAGYDGVVYDSTEYVTFDPNQIKSATENVGTFDSNTDDIRFRATPEPTTIKDGEAKEIRKKYDKKVNTGRKGTLRMTKYNFIEANQDEMRALKEYQKLVKEAYGIDKLPSYLDVYALENRIGSAGFEKFNRFVDGEYEVMQQFIDDYIAMGGETLGSVIDYARAKSGLERNREFTVRDYIDKEAKAKLITKKEAEDMLEQVNRELQNDIITPTQADARRQQTNNMLNTNKNTEEQITAMREQYEAQRDAYRKMLEDGLISYADFNRMSDEYAKKFTGLDVADYSGLSATAEKMGKKADEWKKVAADIVEAFESKHDNAKKFWSAIKACNDAVIKEVYDSGMISKQLYNHLEQQLLWYIPMSGFTEDVAEDVYSYIGGETGAFTPPVKKASGRLSESDDPFAIIANKMQGAILQGNRNRIKLAFLNLVQTYPTDLVTEGKVWLEKKADGTWEEKRLEIPTDTSSDDAAKLIEEYNAEMRSLKKQGLAREHKNKLNVPYVIQTKSHQNDHEIIAYRNGQQYVMYVNGNPQLAKAINGKLKDKGINFFYKLLDKWNRIESANKTSWNPDFIAVNVTRDFEDAVLSTFIDAGVKDAAKLAKTFAAVFPEVVRSISGSENKSGKYAKYFEEFIQNGGETGYSHLHDVEKWKDINQRRWKRLGLGGKALNTPVQAFNGIGSMFSYLNRIAEDSTRFAAYVHSRQKGRTIGESIKAAKDITTNFNKKGSGATEGIWGFLANFMRRWFLFYNPMVQGIYKHWERMTQNRKRYALVFAAMAGAGYLAAVLNKAATDDDDEEKKYFNQSDYTRRTNIMIYTGDGYIKIPLAPVFREMYALGDIMYSIQCGVITPWEGTKEVVNLVRSLFNLEGQSSLKDKEFSWFRFVIPESTEVMADIEDNVTFTGAPLYKDTPWNKFDPEYQKVYNGTWTPLIRLSKAVNDILPHEDYLHEVDDQMAGKGSSKWINPAVWQHIIEDVTGGVGKTVGDVVTIIDNISNDKEIDLYNIPVAKRFYSKPDERTRGRILKNQYYNATDELEYMNDKYKNYTNYLNETLSNSLELANKIVEYWDSDAGKRHKLIKDSKSRIDQLNRELKEAKDDAAVEEITLQKEQEMNNLIESLKALESSNK